MHQGCTNITLRGDCAYPMVQANKNEIILVYAPARPLTMLEFVQIMAEGGG
jgi:hypothetical protein